MQNRFSRVLITGTTSGLGKEFASFYRAKGLEVLTVNRRLDSSQFGSVISVDPCNTLLDITDSNQVASYLQDLKDRHCLPDLILLNAGINRPDNLERFDLTEFNEVWRTNVQGVLTFVSALQELRVSGRTIAVLSSTSNIVPNPGHLGYYTSKLVLHKLFKILAQANSENQYKSVILSPVRTNIMAAYPAPKGLQGEIFDLLAVTPKIAVPALAHFFEGKKKVLYYTAPACLFYFAVSWVLKLWPSLYCGSKPNTQSFRIA